MKNICLALLTFFIISVPVLSQSPEQPVKQSSAELYHQLKQFSNTAKVMYLAAHPDDENTRVIAYLEKARNVETAYLSLTRGDGGQNLIGKDIGVYLGVLRTQELLNARSKDGGQQYFTRAVDFGYSKNPEETFEHWNRDSILKDVVFAIRDFKPDVIICRFPTTGEGGHGHHTASAILAEEAFAAAADKNFKTGQDAHTVTRLLWNSYSWRRDPALLKEDIEMQMGVYLPELGQYVGEIASDARSQHRCQGFGRPLQRGDYSEYFKNIKGSKISEDVLEGIDSTWSKYVSASNVQALLDGIVLNFSFIEPQKSINALQVVESLIKSSNDFTGKAKKLEELNNLILNLAGFYTEWTVNDAVLYNNGTFKSDIEITSASNLISECNYSSAFFKGSEKIENGIRFTKEQEIKIDDKILETYLTDIPHLKEIKSDIFGNSSKNGVIPDSQKNNPYCTFTVSINGRKYTKKSYLKYKEIAPDFGEKYNRALVLPETSFEITENQKIIRKGEWNTITVKVNNRKTDANFKLILDAEGLEFDKKDSYTLQANKDNSISFRIKANSNGVYNLALRLKNTSTGKEYAINERHLSYEHIPHLVNTEKAEITLNVLDIKEHNLNVAYLVGAGDLVVENLRNIGITVTEIEEDALTTFEPSKYDVVIAGIRIYNVSNNIFKIQDKLNNYVKNGGTYVVQYNTSNFLGTVENQFSPKPMQIGRDRVTIESSPVTILKPEHFAFNTPYKITNASWDNWVQERGLYFGEKWDNDFQPLLEMADKGEEKSQGALLYLPYGKGHFYYTGLSFFRNMPAGVEGAYHLFLNIISSSKQGQ